MKYYIYSHTDDDGKCAAAIIYQLAKYYKMEDKDIVINLIDYNVKLDFKDINKDDVVYFTDYSFSDDGNVSALINLIKLGTTVYWIDHHQSSKQLLNDESLFMIAKTHYNFHTIISMDYCGAMLAYMHCVEEVYGIPKLNTDVIPVFFKYIDDYDTWKMKMGNTVQFNAGMKLKDNNISTYFDEIYPDKEYDIFDTTSYDKTSNFVKLCIESGTTISEFNKVDNESKCKYYGFEFKINHKGKIYNCFALNVRGNSLVFGDRINKYDIVSCFIFNGKTYTTSLYTNKEIDCSELCKMLGKKTGLSGGGHKKASGFQSTRCLIKNDITINTKCTLLDRVRNIFGKRR